MVWQQRQPGQLAGYLAQRGSATYFHHLWTEHTKGESIFQCHHARHVYNHQRLPDASARQAALDGIFDSTAYVRGAWTLHALRLEVGDELFFQIIRTYYDRFKGGNATTADFIAVAEEVSGQPLAIIPTGFYYEEAPELPALE